MLAFSHGNVASFRSFGCLFFISMLRLAFHADVSTPRSPDCEISASCFHSQKCQPPFQTITVRPKDSKVTSNCSIVTGGKVRDMTWQDLEKILNASKTGLFLQQIDSKDGNESCRCFSIQYAIPVQEVIKTSSPVYYYPDTRQMELNCTFKGWPRPRVVWYNPDKKQIINGSEGFYISEQLVGKDTLSSLLRNLNIQEKDEGDYICTATNGWSSEISKIIELVYKCLDPKHRHILESLPGVSVMAYNNVSLKCLVEIDPDDCANSMKFQWFFNNSSTPLTSGEKYDIQQRRTNSRCKIDFILTIANVTDDDEGKYICQGICRKFKPSYLNSTSFIQLNVFRFTEPTTETTTDGNTASPEPTTETTTGNTTSPDSSTPSSQTTTSSTSTDSSTPSSQTTTSSTSTDSSTPSKQTTTSSTSTDSSTPSSQKTTSSTSTDSSTPSPQTTTSSTSTDSSTPSSQKTTSSTSTDSSTPWSQKTTNSTSTDSSTPSSQKATSSTLTDSSTPSPQKTTSSTSTDSSTPSSQKTTNSTSTAPADTGAATTGQGNSKSADKWIPAIAILTSGLCLSLTLFTAYHFISKKYGTGYRAWRKMTSRENELNHSLLMTSNHL